MKYGELPCFRLKLLFYRQLRIIEMKYMFVLLFIFLLACSPTATDKKTAQNVATSPNSTSEVSLVVLGTIQDAGSPHIACKKACCKDLFNQPNPDRKVVSLGVIDKKSEQSFLFEATPDMPSQMKMLKNRATFREEEIPNGVFVTHAHIGHYTGLMYLGKEAMNAPKVPVYTMPKMKKFLENNGPWGQLVSNGNILLQELATEEPLILSPQLSVVPFTVPHRDEYSETVGYTIKGPNKAALFIPDIDKWEKWETDIIAAIATVDYAFLDGTFYDAAEINHRDISEIPHPFIIESMEKFKHLPIEERQKIHFIHFNHTNPVIDKKSEQTQEVLRNSFQLARIHQAFTL